MRAGVRRPRVCKRADVAQLVEHSLGKGEVTSSILVISSRDTGIRDQGSGIREDADWKSKTEIGRAHV